MFLQTREKQLKQQVSQLESDLAGKARELSSLQERCSSQQELLERKNEILIVREFDQYYNYSYVIPIQAMEQKLSEQGSAVVEMDGELFSLQERYASLKTKLNISDDQNQA